MKKMFILGLVLTMILCVSITAFAQNSKELPTPVPPPQPDPPQPDPPQPEPIIPVPTKPVPTIPVLQPTPVVITPNAEIKELDPVYLEPITLNDENKLGALIDELTPEHVVTGNCVDLEGNQKCEDFQCDILGDGSFDCQIPGIPELNLTGTSYDRDIEVTILFIGDEPVLLGSLNSAYLSIDDYNTALGLGASIMNLGICVE